MSSLIPCRTCEVSTPAIFCITCVAGQCLDCSKPHLEHKIVMCEPCSHCSSAIATLFCAFCTNKPKVCKECADLHHTKASGEFKRPHFISALKGVTGSMNSVLKHVLSIRADIISKEDVTPDNDILRNIKEKVAKMVRLAAKAGTQAESVHAQKVADEWMKKYKLSKYDLAVKGELKGATCVVKIRGEGSTYRLSEPWLIALCKTVIRSFPNLVDFYFHAGQGTFSFYGIDDAAKSAAQIFAELVQVISDYANVNATCGRFTNHVSLVSYMHGLADGVQAGKIGEMSDFDTAKTQLVERVGRNIISRMVQKLNLSEYKDPKNAFDNNAYNKGVRDGKGVGGQKRKAITA